MNINEILKQLGKLETSDPDPGGNGVDESADPARIPPVASTKRIRNTRRLERSKVQRDYVVAASTTRTPAAKGRKRYDKGVRSDASDAVPLLVGEYIQGETSKSVVACNDYLRLGPARSLLKLSRAYREMENPPTTSWGTLQAWSYRFDWFHRAEIFDAKNEVDRNKVAQDIMNTGFALPYKRVEALKRLAVQLQEELSLRDNLWLHDIRTVGRGYSAEYFEVRRFNNPLVEQFRGVLDDLAAETGGRQKIQRNLNVNLDELTDAQLELLAAGKEYDINTLMSIPKPDPGEEIGAPVENHEASDGEASAGVENGIRQED